MTVEEKATQIALPLTKVVTLWGIVTVNSLADAASLVGIFAGLFAGLYSVLLVSEWFWKKLWRPLLERLRILPPRPRLVLTIEEYEEWQRIKSLHAAIKEAE